MKVAGRIEGISMAFAGGTAVGALIFNSLSLAPVFWFTASAVLALSLFLLLLTHFRSDSYLLVSATFFCCGLGSWITAFISSPVAGAISPFKQVAESGAISLKALIDTLPFPNEETAPFIKALTTGDRSGLPPSTVAAFRKSGASHILALSGLHLGIVYMLVSRLTSFAGEFRIVRLVRSGIVTAAMGLYTLMAGGTPSLIRAFLFICASEMAKLSGRRNEPLKVWCFALLVQLMLNPLSISSVSFQLSYLAMLGIYLLFPIMCSWYPQAGEGFWERHDPMRKVWNAISLTISCQAFTAPVAWLRFRSFPTYFIITNLIAMPLTSLIMTGAVTAIALATLGLHPTFLSWLVDILVRVLLSCLDVIATM